MSGDGLFGPPEGELEIAERLLSPDGVEAEPQLLAAPQRVLRVFAAGLLPALSRAEPGETGDAGGQLDELPRLLRKGDSLLVARLRRQPCIRRRLVARHDVQEP